jgi:type IV pilus assembly protein PilM
MFFGKPKSYLGVDLGAGGVKMVELRREKNRPVLFTYGFTSEAQDVHHLVNEQEKSVDQLRQMAAGQVPATEAVAPATPQQVDEDKIERYASMLKEVCKQSKTVAKTAVVSLPVSGVFHAIVTLPLVKKQEFDKILKAEIKKLLPYSLEETALDYQVLPALPGDKSQRVLVNAVPRSLVVYYTKIFQAAGLKLDSLEPESMALSRSLIGKDMAVTMLVDIGAERTNFFIIDRAVPITHHSIEMGGSRINSILKRILGVDENIVEQMKRDLFDSFFLSGGTVGVPREKFLDLFDSIIDPIAKEIEYSFDLYLRQSGNEQKRPEKVVFTGGAAHLPYLTDAIAEKFKIKCYIGDPWGRVVYQERLKPLLRSIGPRMAVAIGLTLRNML